MSNNDSRYLSIQYAKTDTQETIKKSRQETHIFIAKNEKINQEKTVISLQNTTLYIHVNSKIVSLK